MSNPVVQVIGLQRSGTRWITMLANNNFDVSVHVPGKHNFPWEYYYPAGAPYMVIYKRFDMWLNSVFREPANLPEMRPKMFSDGELRLGPAVELYGDFYDAWARERSVMIDYTELLRDPGDVMSKVAREFGWRRVTSQGWNHAGPDKLGRERRAFYLNEL